MRGYRDRLFLMILFAVLLVLPADEALAAWPPDGMALCTTTGDQRNAQIISDGAGGAIVTWHDSRSGIYDIYVQRVNATGTPQWTPGGVALCTATGDQSSPTIISDGAGGAIVTWRDSRSGNQDIYAQRVNASGTPQWTADGVALCTATGNQSSPKIISDGAGGAMVTWTDNRTGSNSVIYAQRVNASGTPQWTADGVALCTATGYQSSPTIISDGAGGAIVTWTDNRSGNWDIYAQRVNASGTPQWTADGVALCTATGDQLSSTIISDGAGGAIVTWTDNRSGNYDIYAQRVNGTGTPQWTADGVALCTATGGQHEPLIVSDGAGGSIVTWYDQRSGNEDVYVQRVNAVGTPQWTADGVALCTASGPQVWASIASDGASGAIVSWTDFRSGSDIYAQRVNATGTPQWTVNGLALCTATGNQYEPAITSDGGGGTIVAWEDNRSGNYDIYAQKVTSLGNIGEDPVPVIVDGTALCTATNSQTDPEIISDGAGGAIVTWNDSRSGNSDIYARRVDATGTPQWTADGVALCTASGDQRLPKIAPDGSGGAIVTWQDYRSGNWDIYAQRVNAAGSPQWTADGVALCTLTGDQNSCAIVSDGAGGAIVTWTDNRSGNNDVYAQRVDATGTPQWTADGVALCTDISYQGVPMIASDGAGGAIVTWLDSRGNWDIYAQRVDATGTPQWTTDGVGLCTDIANQAGGVIVSDGAGGAIVTWYDFRSGNWDIYAQRVNGAGTPQWTADGVALCTATGGQDMCEIASDGAGGAIVTWRDQRSGNEDTYAQLVNATGTPQWTTDGVALCMNTEIQRSPTIASDSAGGAIVTWYDFRSGNGDIYAQRVDATGTPQWTTDGVALCTVTGEQQYPMIASDGAGGAIVTWQDYRSGNSDIYAQKVTRTGNIGEDPVPVLMAGFESIAIDGGILLQWFLTGLSDAGAFNIYRSISGADVDYRALNERPLEAGGVDNREYSFVDSDVIPGTLYYYKLEALEPGKSSGVMFGPYQVYVEAQLVEYWLGQNTPNPFLSSTRIAFSLKEAGHVRLSVFDAKGRLVRVLADEVRQANHYVELWDGRDRNGRTVPAGMYFYSLEAPGWKSSKKMTLAR